jgi:pimeloyl-ACP methyl ester carboxylesterase
MRGRATRITLLTVTIGLAGCSSDSGVTSQSSKVTTTITSDTVPSDPSEEVAPPPATSAPDLAPFDPGPFAWESYSDQVDTSTITVPVDYANPDGDRFELFVARFKALNQDERIGSLLVNPGGPGAGGSDFAVLAAQIFDQEILDHFDIIGWDPRGTGQSAPPIDCIDDYDTYFTSVDTTPTSAVEHDALIETAKSFARECIAKNRTIIPFVGTNNSARDMDTIRRALGEDAISYFGFSYGSELGAAWATMFPGTVRAAVLDGASDPNAPLIESSLQQITGFENSVKTFLARCSADDTCLFHNDGDPQGAFDRLLISLDRNPIGGAPGRPKVNRDVATTAVVQAMYHEQFWPSLENALAAAQAGDGSGLLALHDSYYQRSFDGTYLNYLEAFQVISCADTTDRQTVEEADAAEVRFHEAAPTLVPADSVGSYFCTFFPPATDPRVAITGAGAGPIVVIGTTGDPATPLDSTRAMRDTLDDGRLVVVTANEHTGYGVNQCVIDVVNIYLIDLEPPEDDTQCP